MMDNTRRARLLGHIIRASSLDRRPINKGKSHWNPLPLQELDMVLKDVVGPEKLAGGIPQRNTFTNMSSDF